VTYKKKLIEVALPLVKINEESAREKSIRQGHPSTLHLWWARRPLAAARAVLWSSLVDDPSAHPEAFPTEEDQAIERKRLFDILERLVRWEAINDEDTLREARAEIVKSCEGELPRIVDPFAGGGAIPLEALRLGLPTYAGDLNPVAVLIERAMLQIPHRFANRPPIHPEARAPLGSWKNAQGIAADVEAYGRWMFEQAKLRVANQYPDLQLADGSSARPTAWIWARTVESPDPSWHGHVPLVGSWVVRNKTGKPLVWVEPSVDFERGVIRYDIKTGGTPATPTVERGKGVCLATGASITTSYIKDEAQAHRLGVALIAVIAEGPQGRIYCSPSMVDHDPILSNLGYTNLGDLPPAGHGLGFRVQPYGFTTWESLYLPHQMHTLQCFSDLLKDVRAEVLRDFAGNLGGDTRRFREGGSGAIAYADALQTLLAFVFDRCAGRWNTLSIWNSVRETVEHVFRMQTVPMTWTFVEANPLSDSTGGWTGQVEWVSKAMEALPALLEASVEQRDARARVREVNRGVIATDPPYYDNVGYADLADFYYVWLRRNVGDIWPDECATLLSPKSEELIADPGRAGSKAAAYKHFESGMREFFSEVAVNSDARYPLTAFYAFKASEKDKSGQTSTGWETFLQGLLESGLAISSTWPIRTEMSGGVRNYGRNSLASSVVLACRPRHLSAPLATRGEFVAALRSEMANAVRILQAGNIAPVDLAQSAIGPGMAIFSRYAKVVEADGSNMTVRAALGLINDVLAEVLSGEESELDADTRFALTWFEQFGHNPGPFGDADTLARAKNTAVAAVEQAGIATSRDGKLRLLERSELAPIWDPVEDRHRTDWEATQYLIRALDSSEADAASLLARLGRGLGERARQLAYLLYEICERRKWADEAAAYNVLVTAWPEVLRLASAAAEPEGGQLF